MSIIIRDGKFYKGNEEVKPEFGNKEQIKALQEALKKANMTKCDAKLSEGEISQYYPIIKFKCPFCEQYNIHEFQDEVGEYHIDNSDVEEMEIECSKCKQDFVVNADKTEKKRMAIYLSYHKENDDEN